MTKLIFLPGAGGSASFWRPVADRLLPERPRHLFAWPGLGDEPHDPNVRGADDLVAMVRAHMHEPVDLIAQSMGGLIAVKAALAAPDRVRRLVLVATSGGVPVEDFGASEWRDDYRRDYPNAASWIMQAREDLSDRIRRIKASTLLLWGSHDPISPIAVGEHLCELLPDAMLHVIAGAGHDLARTHAAQIAPLIAEHLA